MQIYIYSVEFYKIISLSIFREKYIFTTPVAVIALSCMNGSYHAKLLLEVMLK